MKEDVKIKIVTLVFENCDSVDVPVEMIDYMSVNGLVENFHLDKQDKLRKTCTATWFYIRFKGNLNSIECAFGSCPS